MLQYIQTLTDEVIESIESIPELEHFHSKLGEVVKEIRDLKPLHFEPAVQVEFVNARRFLELCVRHDRHAWVGLLQTNHHSHANPDIDHRTLLALVNAIEMNAKVNHHMQQRPQYTLVAMEIFDAVKASLTGVHNSLEHYLGEEATSKPRTMSFVRDAKLRAIVERDFHELNQRVFPMECHKSVVILAGGILEAILFDLLTSDPGRNALALASTKAPKKNKSGTAVKDIEDWTLSDLIDVAFVLKFLPPEREASIDHVLRDYRNFIHPLVEIKQRYSITRSEAMMAMGALLFVIDHVAANYP